MEEDVEEADKEIDMGEAPSTRYLALKKAMVPLVTLLLMAGIWADG